MAFIVPMAAHRHPSTEWQMAVLSRIVLESG
jgi:hypothetical protein